MTERPALAVIGAGLMGAGIALVFAAAGHRVALYDAMTEARATALPRIRDNLKAIGLDPAAAAAVSLHSQLTTAVADADFVIEAAPEDLALKQAGCGAAEAVFVGDSPRNDIAGAAACGMTTVWVNRAGRSYPDGLPRPDYEVRSLDELERVVGDRG